jgi:hypothetical protein
MDSNDDTGEPTSENVGNIANCRSMSRHKNHRTAIGLQNWLLNFAAADSKRARIRARPQVCAIFQRS